MLFRGFSPPPKPGKSALGTRLNPNRRKTLFCFSRQRPFVFETEISDTNNRKYYSLFFFFNFHSLSFSSPWGRSARCWILLLFPLPRRTMHYCGNLCSPQIATIPHTIENWDWTWVSSGLSNQFLVFSFELRGNILSEINTPTVRIEPVFTWRQGGHIGVPKQSSGSRLLFSCERFLLLH